MILLDVLTDVMLPVLIVTALGAWLGRVTDLSVSTLSSLAFRLFSPALVFSTLVDIDLGGDVLLRVVGAVTLGFFSMALAAYLVSRVLRRDRGTTAAATLGAAVANVGNMGLPVSALAFGSEGLGIAIIVFVTATALTFTGGIVLASLGGGGPVRGAFMAPLKVPALWIVLPGLVLNVTGATIPVWLGTTASTLAGAAIPVMLVALGIQFAERMPRMADVTETAGTLGLRLLVGPAVAAGMTLLLGIDGVAQRTLIVLGGMPTAVVASIIAVQYDVKPELVSRTVIVSTVASFATLTVLIALLN